MAKVLKSKKKEKVTKKVKPKTQDKKLAFGGIKKIELANLGVYASSSA